MVVAADEVWQWRNERLTGDAEAAAEIVPECDAELGAGLGKTEEGIAAIATEVTAGSGTELAAGDLAADVVLGAVGMQRRLGAVEHHQQFVLVGMQPREQAIEGDETGASAEDAIEPRPQCEVPAPHPSIPSCHG